MGVKELLERLRGKNNEDSDYIKELNKRMRAEEILVERRKSANQRELERYEKEDFESSVKRRLEMKRKQRQHDINFEHNPLSTKNVVSHTDWEILKEKALFNSQGNMFTNEKNIFKNNPYIFK